jgi:hypothetical protein
MEVSLPTHELPLDELRRRVEEAEKLLRVARQLAADELRDPEQSSRAKDRIASLCKEVNALFPPPAAPGTDPELLIAAEAEEPDTEEGEADAEGLETGAAGDDDGDWDVDYAKLRAAIQNPSLMEQIPEADRPKFKEMAEQLLEAHERQELYARVTAGFEELERTTREGAEEVGRQLAMALTFEELGKKYKA